MGCSHNSGTPNCPSVHTVSGLASNNLQLTTAHGFFLLLLFIEWFKLEVKPNNQELVIWTVFHQPPVCGTLAKKHSNIGPYEWWSLNMNLLLWQPLCVLDQYWHFFWTSVLCGIQHLNCKTLKRNAVFLNLVIFWHYTREQWLLCCFWKSEM